ncbi:helix-turn-helix transcriptional regulator [Janthinobacterium tructae]|nr:helix-turn-helix transcriptional regulator [Janthinobacterium tructae]MDI3294364.1 helix-turn-helix transcriptional regulator [Janthinobacterium tructae]
MSSPSTVKTARERLARNLRAWRAKRGMSQDVLAEHSGLSRVFLSRIEGALETVSLDNIEKLADVLKIDILDLLHH